MSMPRVRIHYSLPKEQDMEGVMPCYVTPEKRRRKREKQRTADTLQQWDGVVANLHHLLPTLKPIVLPNKTLFGVKYSRPTSIKVSFSYGHRECRMLQQEISQMKQMLMFMERQHEGLIAIKHQNQAYHDRQQQQIHQKCECLKAHAYACLLQLQEISQSVYSFSQ